MRQICCLWILFKENVGLSDWEQKFAFAALETYDKKFFEGFGESFRRNALDHLGLELKKRLDLNLEGITQKRHQFFDIPETTYDCYQERFYEVENLGTILAGIRHAGSSIDHPFLSIWSGFEIKSIGELKSIYSRIRQDFFVFRPKHLGIWQSPESPLAMELDTKIQPKLRLLAAIIRDLKQIPSFSNSANLSLEKM